MTLQDRLNLLLQLEGELTTKAHSVFRPLCIIECDFFVLGALKRILANSHAFRLLIEAKIFPCAAAILRMQLDTAMRLNGLTLAEDMHKCVTAVLNGEHFRQQRASSGDKMTDKFLHEKLAKQHAWVSSVYEETSDLVHLSGKQFYQSIAELNDCDGTFSLQVSSTDKTMDEQAYYEVVDAFLDATKLAGLLVLGYLVSRCFPTNKADGA